jgi:hypothetical protein
MTLNAGTRRVPYEILSAQDQWAWYRRDRTAERQSSSGTSTKDLKAPGADHALTKIRRIKVWLGR